jgi:hypothetical protein
MADRPYKILLISAQPFSCCKNVLVKLSSEETIFGYFHYVFGPSWQIFEIIQSQLIWDIYIILLL